jgi:hypothetical protein
MPKITRRRDPLVSATLAFGVDAVNRYVRHLQEHEEPLILAPADPRHRLFVLVEYNFEVSFYRPEDEHLPEPTWRELLRWLEYDPHGGRGEAQFYRAVFKVTDEQLDLPADDNATWSFFGCYLSGTSRAFRFMQEVGVWPHQDGGREDSIGLRMQDIPYVPGGNLVRAVHLDGELSVSLLQHRLNDLAASTALVMK